LWLTHLLLLLLLLPTLLRCEPLLAGMRVRHWDVLSSAVGVHISPGEELQLSRLLKAGILRHIDVLTVSVRGWRPGLHQA